MRHASMHKINYAQHLRFLTLGFTPVKPALAPSHGVQQRYPLSDSVRCGTVTEDRTAGMHPHKARCEFASQDVVARRSDVKLREGGDRLVT
jgi:hypothetical protein